MTDKLYTQSEVDALLQAANEAALRETVENYIEKYIGPTGGWLVSPKKLGDEILALIPQPSALDRLLAEAWLKEAEWWHRSQAGEHECVPVRNNILYLGCERIAYLRRAVKGEPEGKEPK